MKSSLKSTVLKMFFLKINLRAVSEKVMKKMKKIFLTKRLHFEENPRKLNFGAFSPIKYLFYFFKWFLKISMKKINSINLIPQKNTCNK